MVLPVPTFSPRCRGGGAVAACLLATCAFLTSCRDVGGTAAERMVDIGTHRLLMRAEGRGTPVVVLDAGLGDTQDRLAPLRERLSRVTRVVTYDRAGYGASGAGPLPRDCGREADELRALLAAAGVPGPYVLVGHSLGALNAQAFAARRPGDVAGLVLLDPPPPSFLQGAAWPRLRAMAEGMTAEWDAMAAGDSTRAPFFRTIASEHCEMFGRSAELAAAWSPPRDAPLVVMASGRPNAAFGADAAEFQRFWIEQSRILAGRSSRGRFVLVEDSSHYLYEDAADLVADEVLAVVRSSRGD